MLYAERRIAVIAGYMAIYIISAALSLQGAAILTIAAGALFGLVTGTVIISFALLGIFPLAAIKLIAFYKSKKEKRFPSLPRG